MDRAVKLYLWAALLAALTGLFYLAAPEGSALSRDGTTPLTVLTAAGPREMTMAEYLPGAVAAEMPAGFSPEALKAQAVAVRTFALACRRHDGADVCADSGCCVAWLDEAALRERWGGGFEANMAAVAQAVAATDGEYLAYGGQAIQAAFHSCSAGRTEDSGALWSPLPYLISVESPETAADVPGLVTTVSLTADELAAALDLDPAGDPAGWVEALVPDGAGRVETAALCGKTFSGAAMRSLLGLRSTAFTVDWDGERFLFTVSGYGHGVGMSQYGANVYAAQGLSYRDILAHYYPGTEIM